MLKKTQEFYNISKLRSFQPETGKVPLVYTHPFKKEYPRFESLNVDNLPEDNFLSLLSARESTRKFSSDAVDLSSFFYLLNSVRIIDSVRDPEKRTYPSGGARFPVEIYPILFNICELKPGVYHYNTAKHTIEFLWDLFDSDLQQIVSPDMCNPALSLMLTAAIQRSEVKYGYRAFNYSLLEAGHLAQNLLLACSSIGLGCCPIAGFINEYVSKLLDLSEHEIPIYSIVVGKKE